MTTFDNQFFIDRAAELGRYLRQDDWSLAQQQKILDKTLTFATKAEYLLWVAGWKAAYKVMTLDTRAARKAFIEHRNERRRTGVYKEYPGPFEQTTREQRHAMMLMRAAAKRLSWSRKRAAQQPQATA